MNALDVAKRAVVVRLEDFWGAGLAEEGEGLAEQCRHSRVRII